MKMTSALWAMLLFAVLLSLAGPEFSTFGADIIDKLLINDPDSLVQNLAIIGGVAAALVTLTTRFFAGQAPITTPAIVFMASLLAIPTGVITASTMPTFIRLTVLGFWLFLAISGVGGAIKGDF